MDRLFEEPSRTKTVVRIVGLLVIALLIAAVVVDATVTHYLIPQFGGGGNDNTNTRPTGGSGTQPLSDLLAAQSTLKQFKSNDELKAFLDEHAGQLASSSSFLRADVSFRAPTTTGPQFEQLGPTLGLGTSDLLAGPTGTDYSQTNVQVAGVDEADIVKSDGKYLYVVSKKTVSILDAYPAADAQTLSTITLDSAPTELYLNGSFLTLYGRQESVSSKPFASDIRPSSSYAFFKVYDLADKRKPKLVRDLTFEGQALDSRMVGEYVYFITTQPGDFVVEDYPIPMVVEGNALLPVDGKRCNCPDVYYVEQPSGGYAFTTVTAINVTDVNQPIHADAYLLSGTETIYVSPENIYLAYTKNLPLEQVYLETFIEVAEPKLPAKQVSRIREIQAASSTLLTDEEKLMKIAAIAENVLGALPEAEQTTITNEMQTKLKSKIQVLLPELEKTVIHKISFNKDKLELKGSGEVVGHLLDQFSMDEHDGYLRVATTKSQTWSEFEEGATRSFNNVYVLDANLKVVGKVENLAKGEQIYAARFMQGRAYLVTFRQTDPLFVIDLRDPKKPAVLGELKVPGFSSYLHPYDETTLIGFGKQGTETGQITGLKLSLFDVSDVNNLKEIDTYEMGDAGSDSIALNDHKAFLFSGGKNLLVVPVTLRERTTEDRYSSTTTQGAMVFTLTKEGFTFRKRIDHSEAGGDSSSISAEGYSYYDTTVKRSLYINEMLYTVSTKYVKMHNLDSLNEVKSVTLGAT